MAAYEFILYNVQFFLSLKKRKGDGRLKCGTACKKEKVTKEMQAGLRKKTVLGLLLPQSSRNENLTESLCGEVVSTKY
ncbi:hypothetical protein HPG69_017707 [Diceros bicornis minor]|uniref:Uncharacterized protein n=1 Tax=Diceros bicornis minor TaxID=77932 RepID=A0A7J7FGS2_DICBM|nr:hypothetical protein HPG69_017707 [Diceros bicornis minor]